MEQVYALGKWTLIVTLSKPPEKYADGLLHESVVLRHDEGIVVDVHYPPGCRSMCSRMNAILIATTLQSQQVVWKWRLMFDFGGCAHFKVVNMNNSNQHSHLDIIPVRQSGISTPYRSPNYFLNLCHRFDPKLNLHAVD